MSKLTIDSSYFINSFWLKFFTASKYIAVIYDEKGEPQEVLNRKEHKLFFTVEHLLRGRVFDYYDVPETGDLNSLFTEDGSVTQYFNSRNRVEYPIISGFLKTRSPLSFMSLVRINHERFAGIVFFDDYSLQFFSDKPAVAADESGRILMHNDLFQDLVTRDPGRDLLGTPLTSLVSFDRTPLELPAAPALALPETGLRWKAGEKPWFRLSAAARGTLSEIPQGLRWVNEREREYVYLALNELPALLRLDFELRICFSPFSRMLPSVIFGGGEPDPLFPPDLHGHTLAGHAGGYGLFKTASHILRKIRHRPLEPDQTYWLTVRKSGVLFTFYLDETELGRCAIEPPSSGLSGGLLLLFLRPGERLVLRAMEMDSALLEPGRPEDGPEVLSASYLNLPQDRYFRVPYKCRYLKGENAILYDFEDVTSLRRNIEALENEKGRLSALLSGADRLCGISPAMAVLRKDAERIACTELSVLIEGETGTGKEVLARAIHDASARKKGPFVKIDCAAIPETLIESELFGHEKGAFTGASERREGRFEQAKGGTVFLDEIANLPLSIQAKLLNVLQDRSFRRLGGEGVVRADVRLIAASNIPVAELIKTGRFRTDLYYRLNQFGFSLPPLRERQEDVALLARLFVEETCLANKLAFKELTPDAVGKLLSHPWPGNVRELKNVIQRAVLLVEDDKIGAEDITLPAEGGQSFRTMTYFKNKGLRKRLSDEAFQKGMAENGGRVAKTAKALDISRVTAYRWAKRLGLPVFSRRRSG